MCVARLAEILWFVLRPSEYLHIIEDLKRNKGEADILPRTKDFTFYIFL